MRSALARLLPVLLIATAACWAAAATPYRASGPAIRSDGSGYQAWTRALVTGDLSFCGNEELEVVRAISAVDLVREVCQNKYPPGMALVRLPVTAWLVDRDAADPRPSPREHEASLWLGSVTLVATAALVADSARRLGAGAVPTGVALLCGTFGTGVFHYATYDGSFSHGTSGLLVAAACWSASRSAERHRSPSVASTLVIAALLTLTRNTNVVVIASSLLAWIVWQRVPVRRVRVLLRHVGPAAAGVLIGAALQLAYNRYATGAWALSSYGTEPFLLDRPRQREVLLSYERGLLTWYPVMGVGLLGLLLTAKGRRMACFVLLLVVPVVVMYGFWFSWNLGGGFGHRGFVEVVPAVVIAFALGLEALGNRWRSLVAGGMMIATLVTTSLMVGYWRGTIGIAGTTGEEYWSHVYGTDSIATP